MPITEKVFEGKLTWGPFEMGKKSNTHTFSYTWNEKTTTIKRTILKAEFWWETGCTNTTASVYFNNEFVGKESWWLTCEYKMFSKQVNLNNGNNTVVVEGDTWRPLPLLSITLAYRITIQIEYEGKEPGQPPGPPSPPGGIDLSQLLPLLAFIPIILILLFRRKKKRRIRNKL